MSKSNVVNQGTVIEYTVQSKFYFASLGDAPLKPGDILEYNAKTYEVTHMGKTVKAPQMQTALQMGWILESSLQGAVRVEPQRSTSKQYPVTGEHRPVGSVGGSSKNSVEAQDYHEITQVKLFSKPNVGSIKLAQGGASDLANHHRQAEIGRLKNAAENSTLTKVRYTEGVTLTTSTGNRALNGAGQYWDGGTQSEMVGHIGAAGYEPTDRSDAFEETDDIDLSIEDVNADLVEFTQADLQDRLSLVLAALPAAHAEDVRLHIAILRAIIPGFPEWDPRAHWKTKLKNYRDTIEGNESLVNALHLVENESFWRHINV